jgi:hypothetical protein
VLRTDPIPLSKNCSKYSDFARCSFCSLFSDILRKSITQFLIRAKKAAACEGILWIFECLRDPDSFCRSLIPAADTFMVAVYASNSRWTWIERGWLKPRVVGHGECKREIIDADQH